MKMETAELIWHLVDILEKQNDIPQCTVDFGGVKRIEILRVQGRDVQETNIRLVGEGF